MPKRVLAAFLQQENNTFFPTRSDLGHFERCALLRDGEVISRFRGTRTDWGALLDEANARGWVISASLHAHAQPAGIIARDSFERLASYILDGWRDEHDGAILMLHGSMVAEGIEDCEGEVLRRLRAKTDKPIVVTLDPHANVTQVMADNANAILAYRTTPHVDQMATARRAAAMLGRIFDESLRTSVILAKPPTMTGLDGARTIAGHGPMIDLLARANEAESREGVLAVSLQAGFPFADVPDIGPTVAVTVASVEPRHCELAAGFAAEIWRRRDERTIVYLSIAEAIGMIGSERPTAGPLVIADPTDNPGSGAPGDEVNLLAALLHADPADAVFFAVADPAAVAACRREHVGARVSIVLGRFGGRAEPVGHSVSGKIEAFSDGAYRRRGPYFTDTEASLGPSVLLRIGRVRVVVTSAAMQIEERAQLKLFGLKFEELAVLVCKGNNHFRADLEPIASRVVFVDAGGICSPDPATRRYLRIRRPVWPLDKAMFGLPKALAGSPGTALEPSP